MAACISAQLQIMTRNIRVDNVIDKKVFSASNELHPLVNSFKFNLTITLK